MASLTEIFDPEIPIKIAEKIGSLSTSAVLALVCLYLGWLVYKKHKDDKVETLERLKAWEVATIAEERQTATISKSIETTKMLADVLNALSNQVTRMLAIIEERLPRQGAK